MAMLQGHNIAMCIRWNVTQHMITSAFLLFFQKPARIIAFWHFAVANWTSDELDRPVSPFSIGSLYK